MRLLILLTAILLPHIASAQLGIELKSNRKQFVAYEAIEVTAFITNRSGQPLTLRNRMNLPWVEFFITDHTGKTLPPLKKISYTPVELPTGQTVSSKFILNNAYNITTPGNYSVYAVIRMPGETASQGTRSPAAHFSVTKGVVAWSQRVGVPGSQGDQRKYNIITFGGDQYPELYAQVEDTKRGRMLATYTLGRHISFRKFHTALDKSNNLNVIFQTTPALSCYTVISPAGDVVARKYYKNASVGSPRLQTDPNGNVQVINAIPYDPAKEAAEKAKYHGISEIPGGIEQ